MIRDEDHRVLIRELEDETCDHRSGWDGERGGVGELKEEDRKG